jgi:signal peptidase I
MRGLKELVEAVAIALVVFFALQVGVRNYMVEGSSMNPTLHDQERMFVNRLAYLHMDMQRISELVPFWQVEEEDVRFLFGPPQQGDIVVFQYDGANLDKPLVKRIIATPGQVVEIRRGVVYVDGDPLDEPYIDDEVRGDESMRPLQLEDEEYFVLGDNRIHSYDSRDWGPLPQENIIGRAWITYWPFSNLEILENSAP